MKRILDLALLFSMLFICSSETPNHKMVKKKATVLTSIDPFIKYDMEIRKLDQEYNRKEQELYLLAQSN